MAVVLDQLSKAWAVSRLSPEGTEGIHLVGDLRLKLAFNSGMAFSQGQGKGFIIGIVACVIVGGLLWFARTVEDWPSRFAIGLVVGGAIGNVVDRIFRAGIPGVPRGALGGRVVDFIYTGWFPTFNIADSCVVVGGILLALLTLRAPPERDEAPSADPIPARSDDGGQ